MTERPRCLIVTSNFPPFRGGSAVVYQILCEHGGGAVLALAPYADAESMKEFPGWRAHDKESSYVIHRIKTLKTRSIRSTSLLHTLWLNLRFELPLKMRTFRHIIEIIRRHNVKIVCIGELISGGWLAPVCKYLLGCKTIIYVHGEEITIHGSEWRLPRLRRYYLRMSNSIVAASSFAQKALVDKMGVHESKITLIFNGVDGEKFFQQPKDMELMNRYGLAGQRVLLSVGRLVPKKGVDRTLAALPSVLRLHSNTHYLVVGVGPYRAELEDIAHRLGLSRYVTFVGDVPEDEIAMHYALADVFVLPNRETHDGDTEGFGLVFLEANACGVPVIAGQAGGAQDAVTDGYNGLTVDGDDAAAIAAAITRLLEDPGLRARLREGGLERARESDWRSRAAQFQALCQELTVDGRISVTS